MDIVHQLARDSEPQVRLLGISTSPNLYMLIAVIPALEKHQTISKKTKSHDHFDSEAVRVDEKLIYNALSPLAAYSDLLSCVKNIDTIQYCFTVLAFMIISFKKSDSQGFFAD